MSRLEPTNEASAMQKEISAIAEQGGGTTKVEQLIQQYCPDGVEYVQFEDIFDTITDYTAAGSFKSLADNVKYLKVPDYAMLIRTTDIKSNFSKGDFIYISKSAYDYLWRVKLDKECIVLPNVGNCGEVYYIKPDDLPYENCALAPNAILVRSSIFNNRFLYYYLQVGAFQKQLSKITSPVGQSKFNKTELKKLIIPVPPLPVQEEIVRILDTLTELQAELQAELQKRLQQYNYYRDNLLSFEGRTDIEWKKLGEICNLSRGKVYSKSYIEKNAGEYPVYSSQTANNGELGRISTYDYDGEYLTWTTDGAYAGTIFYRKGKFSITNVCGLISPKEDNLNIKFLFYWLSIKAPDYVYRGMGNPKLMSNQMEPIKVPIPPLAEQQRIVSILDRFNTLTTDITAGLPAEIEARRKQYEYYRDQLLTFKQKA